MQPLITETLRCPYCNELIEVLLDASFETQHYVEDCFVCCRPIHFALMFEGENYALSARREDEC